MGMESFGYLDKAQAFPITWDIVFQKIAKRTGFLSLQPQNSIPTKYRSMISISFYQNKAET
jgi:hypothetical protein